MNIRIFFIALFFAGINNQIFGQCCSGGTGSPIAGGESQGVLSKGQVEVNTNLQYIRTDKFFTGNKPAEYKYFDRFQSGYLYSRVTYGISERLTISTDLGYYLFKEEIGLNNDPARTYRSSGVSDLILFPKYEIYHRNKDGHKVEFTAGIGLKIPLGSSDDSTGNIEPYSGVLYYVRNPISVQVTSGALDGIFYLFFLKGFPEKDFRVFTSFYYLRKGWNALGEKLGDFASLAVFASREMVTNTYLTLQLRGEWNDQMKINPTVLLFDYPAYDPFATGYKKIFLSPQLSYSSGRFIWYGLMDIPLYQHLTKTQVGSKLQVTTGISWRFYPF